MNSCVAAEQLLSKICSRDRLMDLMMKNQNNRTCVLNQLSEEFKYIVEYFPHLVEDIQNRIVDYHCNKGTDGKITDFIAILAWYKLSLQKGPAEYWNPEDKYYSLRMNEVINMFLIARFNFGLV